MFKAKGHISFIEKNYKEFILNRDKRKHFDNEFLIEETVKTTIQRLYDKELFDKYNNADAVLKD